jgi:hypothetical protein
MSHPAAGQQHRCGRQANFGMDLSMRVTHELALSLVNGFRHKVGATGVFGSGLAQSSIAPILGMAEI